MTYNEALRFLGLEDGYDDNSLKKVYRTMMRKYHPDLFEQSGKEAKAKALEMTKKLNEAYEILSKAQPKYNNYYESKLSKTKNKALNDLLEMIGKLDKSAIPYDYFVSERFILIDTLLKIKTANIEVEIFVLLRNMKEQIKMNSKKLYNQSLEMYQIEALPFYKLVLPIYLEYKDSDNFDGVVDAYSRFKEMKNRIEQEIENAKIRYSNKISYRMNRIMENYQDSQYYQFIEEKANSLIDIYKDEILNIYSCSDYYSNKSKYDKEINVIYKHFEKNISKYLTLAHCRIDKMKKLYLKLKKLGYREQRLDEIIEPLADNLFEFEFNVHYNKLLLASFIQEKDFNTNKPIEVKRKTKKL